MLPPEAKERDRLLDRRWRLERALMELELRAADGQRAEADLEYADAEAELDRVLLRLSRLAPPS